MKAAFEKESGRDLKRFFDAWIHGSGTPEVAFSWAPAAGGAERAVALRVEQRGNDSEFPVTVTLRYADDSTEDTQIVVSERTAEFRLPIKGQLKEVTLNRDGFTPLEEIWGIARAYRVYRRPVPLTQAGRTQLQGAVGGRRGPTTSPHQAFGPCAAFCGLTLIGLVRGPVPRHTLPAHESRIPNPESRYYFLMETVTLTIDGRDVTVEKGKTVLQAAIENGISVPYYCYHPGIGIDGSCRVCIVKIEKMPKLQTSCSTVCDRGHGRRHAQPEVVAARAGVFEFLLVNHPLDCPVCDKGGECPLQDFPYTFGPDQSRMEFPRRVFDGEGVKADVDFGPTLMLNRQRCIMCTRCVRFMQDVDGDAQIDVIDRGYGSEIATFRDEGVHSLISGNLMDVCPVGAITTRDYRFKSRPVGQPERRRHDLHAVLEGLQHHRVDQGQAGVGEGVAAHPLHAALQPRRQRLLDVRHRPLRLSLDRGRRPPAEAARARRDDGVHSPVDVARAAIAKLRDRLAAAGTSGPKGVRFLLSAHASHEELFLFRRLTEELLGADGPNVDQPSAGASVAESSSRPRTKFKVPAVDAPNVNGARIFGFVPGAVGAEQGAADISALRAGGREPAASRRSTSSTRVRTARSATRSGLSTPAPPATLPLLDRAGRADDRPGARGRFRAARCIVRREGGVLHERQGRLQGTARAMAPPGDAMEDWQIWSTSASRSASRFDYTTAPHVRARHRRPRCATGLRDHRR